MLKLDIFFTYNRSILRYISIFPRASSGNLYINYAYIKCRWKKGSRLLSKSARGLVGSSVFINFDDILIVKARHPRALRCCWRIYLILIPLCFYADLYRKQIGFFEILYDGKSKNDIHCAMYAQSESVGRSSWKLLVLPYLYIPNGFEFSAVGDSGFTLQVGKRRVCVASA